MRCSTSSAICSTASTVRISHSQIARSSHPSPRSVASFFASRLTVLSSFGFQYRRLVSGMRACLHPSCWCQKQPRTWTASRSFGNTCYLATSRAAAEQAGTWVGSALELWVALFLEHRRDHFSGAIGLPLRPHEPAILDILCQSLVRSLRGWT